MRHLVLAVTALCIILLAGCGGGGGGPQPPDERHTLAAGPLVVQTAQGPDIGPIALFASVPSPYVFTGFADANLVGLRYSPAPGRLVGRYTNDAIVTSAMDGSGRAVVLETPGGDPRWSPDGSRIAWPSGTTVMMMRPDGTALPPVPAPSAWHLTSWRSLTWGPDGHRLYLMGQAEPPGGAHYCLIYSLDLDSGTWTWLADTPVPQAYRIDCRCDGRYLVVAMGASVRCLDVASGEWVGAWQWNVVAPFSCRWARWSPDGRYYAFEEWDYAGGTGGTLILDVPQHRCMELPRLDEHYPDWAPDGSAVLYTVGSDLWSWPMAGGAPTRLASPWGIEPDVWGQASDHARVLIGAARTDYGGKNPPFASPQQAAIVALSDTGLARAVAVTAKPGSLLSLTDRTPAGSSAAVVVEVAGAGVSAILRDEGAGMPPTIWSVVDASESFPQRVLIVLSTQNAQVTAVIPVLGSAPAAAVQPAAADDAGVDLRGGTLVVSGAGLRAYDDAGHLTGGAGRVGTVTLDAGTGRLLSAN